MKHLVEGHHGDYYISGKNRDFIEAECEQCGESDLILTSWDDTKENARINALLRFFMKKTLNARKDIYERALLIGTDPREDIVNALHIDIESNDDIVCNIANELFENNSISDEEYCRILHISTIERERQEKMVKYFEEELFTTDSSTGLRKLKIPKK